MIYTFQCKREDYSIFNHLQQYPLKLKVGHSHEFKLFIIFLYFIVPRDCADVYKSGRHRNGIYTIDPDGEGAIEVYCDQVGKRKALSFVHEIVATGQCIVLLLSN